MTESPFLAILPEHWIASNEQAFAILDRFPVSHGHALVITRRLVLTWFEATPSEQLAVMQLVNVVKQKLDQTLQPKPDGYNVGFNAGDAAGQTVPHLHVHVIPRYFGDVEDPRGGVRSVIPEKANYLSKPDESPAAATANSDAAGSWLSTGHPDSPLWEHLSWRLAGAHRVDVLASFVQLSGLDVIEQRLFDALRNGAQVRILVSDYLYISDARALCRLFGWCGLAMEEFCGTRLHARLIESAKLPSAPASFHPKAWHIDEGDRVFISVGSSNLSRAALQTGIEWNLVSSGRHQQQPHAQVATEFELLWHSGTPITPQLVAQYTTDAAKYRQANFVPESIDKDEIPSPRAWQVEALAALRRLRAAGHARALVAVATGMGKTWLAAFDVCQLGSEIGRRPRVLIIAHRAHILAQAEAALSLLLDHRFSIGATAWYIGQRSELAGELVVASVQKLSRPEGLAQLAEQHFDYVIIDEVHHAHAPSYRRVLAKLRCDFALGLTATPERTDGIDVATIFDDNLAYQATIGDGIAEEALVPFHYVGIKDTVDFRQVPWRGGRFDPDELEQRVIRSERMDRLRVALQTHVADRTLVFCCSRRHAIFARDWLRSQGITSAAVFSGDGSDSYGESLQRLHSGELQSLCVVDMFNEGLDIPAVDRIVMLRPTESKIIFLQQLGRGLRAAEGKTRLLVIDFVGNHRIFAQRIVHLFSLRGPSDQWHSLKDWLADKPVDLPPGCLLDVELDAKDMLKQFLPQGRTAAIEGYRAQRDDLGRRPTALEVFTRGFLPRAISASAGSWFAFAQAEGDLGHAEQEAVQQFDDWFKTIETTSLNKSYKLVVLRVLLDSGNLFSGVNLHDFAKACRRFLQSHEVLRRDLQGENHGVDHDGASDRQWADWWIRWPISRWLAAQNGTTWFTRQGDTFRFNIGCPEHLKPALESLTEELVDWRLAAYATSRRLTGAEDGELAFEAKVSHSGGRPILFLPEQKTLPGRPIGPTRVQLPDGDQWQFKFVKVACNVAAPVGQKGNRLGELLQKWFGKDAGLPGTHFTVRFESKGGRWKVAPSNAFAAVVGEPAEPTNDWLLSIADRVPNAAKYTTHVPVFDLTAAAGGWGDAGVPTEIGWIAVPGQKLGQGMFVARVIGRSMEPKIPSGAWCLLRPCPMGSREGRLLLIQLSTHADPEDGGRYTVKRYRSTKRMDEDGWQHATIELQPLNPDYQPIRIATEDADDLRIIGEFVAVIASPETP